MEYEKDTREIIYTRLTVAELLEVLKNCNPEWEITSGMPGLYLTTRTIEIEIYPNGNRVNIGGA